jgi:hypothetical protein
MRIVRTLAKCLIIAGLSAMAARADDMQLVIDVASGRQFRGSLDSVSSSDHLVLRSEQAGVTLRRPIRWERVTRAKADGMPVEVGELKARVEGVGDRGQGTGDRGRGTGDRGQKPANRKIEMRGDPAVKTTSAEEEAVAEDSPRVAMVAFDAAIANWDADVETDGVLIDVAPVDINRRVVPVSGTVEVELFAPQRRTLDLAPQSGGDTLEVVERWTRAITPADFGPSGVRLRLPFGAITPELQPNWTAWHYGLVHVRLSIPGHGVFEDSRDGVRIKPFAPNRDRLEMKTGQRFLSTENLGRRE